MTEKEVKTLKRGDWLFCTVGNEETQFHPFEQHPIKGCSYQFVGVATEYDNTNNSTEILVLRYLKWNMDFVYPSKYFVKFKDAKEYKIVKTLYGVPDET